MPFDNISVVPVFEGWAAVEDDQSFVGVGFWFVDEVVDAVHQLALGFGWFDVHVLVVKLPS